MDYILPDSKIFSQITHIPVARTDNLGDAIQSEAAARLFNVRNYVDRDHPETWPKSSLVPLVGWYSWGRLCESAEAVIVSFHAWARTQCQIATEPRIRDWMKSQIKRQGFPALCRDTSTSEFLRTFGIDAELHGCVTSSLKSKGVRKHLYLSIDYPHETAERYMKLSQTDKSLIDMSFDGMLRAASDRIDLLDAAAHVVTSRLHVILPCKALGTAVAYDTADVRFPERLSDYI
jgi:hypothetical protein